MNTSATLSALLAEAQSSLASFWENGAYGQSVADIAVAIAVFLFFFLTRSWWAGFLTRRLRAFFGKTKSGLDDAIFEAVLPPLNLVPILAGLYFVYAYLDFSGEAEVFLNNLIISLASFLFFWAAYLSVTPIARHVEGLERKVSPAVIGWGGKTCKALAAFIGAASILETWGIQVAPILAGLGLFGVAVALGAQDLFKNLIAGLLILLEKRFNPGDWILVEGVVEGVVEVIGFRSTRIRRFDKVPVFVPNAKLSDNAVKNFSSMTHRRISWKIGVLYATTVPQLRRIREEIERYLLECDDFANPPEVPTFVRIDSFADSAISIMVYCFTKSTVWGEWLEAKERLAYKIKDIVLAAGSDFAFPSRTVYLEPATPDASMEDAEAFIPPEDAPRKA